MVQKLVKLAVPRLLQDRVLIFVEVGGADGQALDHIIAVYPGIDAADLIFGQLKKLCKLGGSGALGGGDDNAAGVIAHIGVVVVAFHQLREIGAGRLRLGHYLLRSLHSPAAFRLVQGVALHISH